MSSLPLPIRVAAGLAAIALERARKLPQDASEWPMTAVSQAMQLSMRVQQRITELAIKGDEALASLHEPQEDPPWAVFDEELPRQPSYLRPDTDLGAAADVSEVVSPLGAPADAESLGEAAFEDELAAYNLDDQDTTAEELSWFEAIDEVYAREPEGPSGATTAPGAGVEAAATEGGATTEPGARIEAAAADTGATTKPGAAVEAATDTGGTGGNDTGPRTLPSYPALSLASLRGRLRVLSVADLEDLLAYERGHDDRPEFVRMLTNRIAAVRAT